MTTGRTLSKAWTRARTGEGPTGTRLGGDRRAHICNGNANWSIFAAKEREKKNKLKGEYRPYSHVVQPDTNLSDCMLLSFRTSRGIPLDFQCVIILICLPPGADFSSHFFWRGNEDASFAA